MIAYLRSKRQLIGRNTELSGIVAKQVDDLAAKDEQLAEYDRALSALRASFDRTRINRELAAEVREETALQSAIGAGMVQPLSRRVRDEPTPWQYADDIAEEADMKRKLDGLGDPA